MYCNECGKELDSSAKFCTYCGKKQITVNKENDINELTETYIRNDNKQSIYERHKISPKMQKRLKKIDKLIEKGYSLKIKNFMGETGWHVLKDPEGREVYTSSQKYKNDLLPGFSWIGFFWGPFIAVQIRHWDYFWLLGICGFVFDCILALTNLPLETINNLNSGFGVGAGIIYAYAFPYQRWLQSKSNKKDIEIWKSIFLGLILLVLINLPGFIVSEIINPSSF